MAACNRNKVYVGDIGTKIKLDTGSDISTGTLFKIKYKKPDKTTGEWVAELEGTDYVVYYTVADDLDVAGPWMLQAYVELPTWSGHGERVTFTVYDNFE